MYIGLPNLGLNGVGGGLKPILNFDFLSTETPPSALTSSGGAGGTRVNNAGTVVTASAPRYDYNPNTLAARGLLIESQRTNLFVQSEDFATTWTTSVATITPNTTTAPSGAVTADTLTATGVTGFVTQTITIAAGNSVALTLFVKPNTVNWFRFRVVATDIVSGWFNVATGASGGTTGTGIVLTGVTLDTPIAYPNGWYRCTMRLTTATTTTLAVGIGPAATNNTNSVNGDSVFIWGAQAEIIGASTSFATTYIPTTAVTVTRTADLETTPALGSSGSVYIEFTIPTLVTSASTNNGLLEIDASATGSLDAILLYVTTAGAINVLVNVGGAQQSLIGANGSVTAGAVNKVALSWDPTSIAVSLNGTTTVTSSPASMPVTNRAILGDIAGQKLNGWLSRVRTYPLVPNATLSTLTA